MTGEPKGPNAEIHVTTELLRMILDLPPEYEVVGVEQLQKDYDRAIVKFLLKIPFLNDTEQGSPRHLITPHYDRVDGTRAVLRNVIVTPADERNDR